MFRLAVRSSLARAAPRAAPQVAARSFLTSIPRLSDHAEPMIQGPGGKTGEVPTDFEQATGLERFELLYKLKGEEAFSLEPLEVTRAAGVDNPIKVFSLDHERIVGCTGFPVDSHDTILFPVGDSKATRCPECGTAYQVDFQGADHGDHHH
ncbi:cytochrome c oxidase subunit VB-domain-containing protein [Leucosporidium creatinivorum]|uniref:Cytochrome c oxidase subunit VB-domain-containing protein n=1 Tax=Leucosporidium creatinivorum TaxID=106004 RepID=A0A1Y2E262_9BASI|nr:cytochrome c oxidase subunit VB-domain-containing protein [Leucosporidium creatinivorum]